MKIKNRGFRRKWVVKTKIKKMWLYSLSILTGKKHPQIKFQPLRKVWIWTLGSLVHQINSSLTGSETKIQFSKKYKVATGKTSVFVIGPFCTSHTICLNIGSWHVSFVWKWCVFNIIGFNLKNSTPVFLKRFLFSRKFVKKLKYLKRSKFAMIVT